MSTIPPVAVVIDIEGTALPIAFVANVLFPFARKRLADYIDRPDPEVQAAIAEARRMVPDQDPLTTFHHWMDQDAKITALKDLQGLIWREDYAAGTLTGPLYPDVAPNLKRWRAAGLRLFVYSSGSVEAQKLLFKHSADGDLSGLFSGNFDTNIGAKRDPDSYARLAIGINVPSMEILFLSDVEAELDAAATAGYQTCQLVRPEDKTLPSDRHPTAPDFTTAARLSGLPTP